MFYDRDVKEANLFHNERRKEQKKKKEKKNFCEFLIRGVCRPDRLPVVLNNFHFCPVSLCVCLCVCVLFLYTSLHFTVQEKKILDFAHPV